MARSVPSGATTPLVRAALNKRPVGCLADHHTWGQQTIDTLGLSSGVGPARRERRKIRHSSASSCQLCPRAQTAALMIRAAGLKRPTAPRRRGSRPFDLDDLVRLGALWRRHLGGVALTL